MDFDMGDGGDQDRQQAAQRVLGAILATTGVGHLTFLRKPFHAQVPPWLPLDPGRVVTLSGGAELLLAASLLMTRSQRGRRRVGWAAAAFFVAIFPGNIAQWQYHRDAFGLNTDTRRLLRLFGQPVLIAWALWATGALQSGKGVAGLLEGE